jgi:amino acid adenylation domain-containing protein
MSPEGSLLTYAELNRRANRLAHRLRWLGVDAEAPVAVLMDRSTQLAVAMLGILKAGGAYVPLHTGQPVGRHRRCLDSAGVVLLVTDSAWREATAGLGAEIIVLDTDPDVAAASDIDPAIHVAADQLAYIMHTSGSTGEPKGVAVSHRNVICLVRDNVWSPASRDKVLMHGPYAFDISTYELWVPLLSGGEVAPPGELDVETTALAVATSGPAAVNFTAGLFGVLAAGPLDFLDGVTEVLTGGDRVDPAAVRRLLDARPDITLRHLYGPTEATVCVTSHLVDQTTDLSHGLPLGRPLDNTRIYILDEWLRPAVPGTIGEMYLAGAGLARGYLGGIPS